MAAKSDLAFFVHRIATFFHEGTAFVYEFMEEFNGFLQGSSSETVQYRLSSPKPTKLLGGRHRVSFYEGQWTGVLVDE